MDWLYWIGVAVLAGVAGIFLDYAKKRWYSPAVDSISTLRLNDPRVHPVLRDRITATIEDCAAVGIYLRVTRAAASPNEQHALFIQGRQPLDVVNEARRAVGWPLIVEEQNHEVTNADWDESMHVYGLAADVDPSENGMMAPFNPDWTVFDKAGTMDPKWQTVLDIASRHKLAEGANWTGKKRDYPHLYPVELAADPTEEMKQTFKDAGLASVWESLNSILS